MTAGLISIGTNSTRLLAERDGVEVARASVGTRLGAGVADGTPLDPAAVARTLAAIDAYLCRLREAGAAVDAIATSVLRRASDGAAFAAEVERRVGVAPRVLSGTDEATFAFLGATECAPEGIVGVLDVGGGSAELAVDDPAGARARGRVAQTRSVEVGAVRLAERHPALLGVRALDAEQRSTLLGAAAADAASVLAPYAALRGVPRLIGVGGTVFTAAAMIAGEPRYDGVVLARADLRALIDALLARDLDGRRALPLIRPQRADILPAGLIVVDEACRLLGVERFVVSERDLLAGYLRSPAYRARPLPPESASRPS